MNASKIVRKMKCFGTQLEDKQAKIYPLCWFQMKNNLGNPFSWNVIIDSKNGVTVECAPFSRNFLITCDVDKKNQRAFWLKVADSTETKWSFGYEIKLSLTGKLNEWIVMRRPPNIHCNYKYGTTHPALQAVGEACQTSAPLYSFLKYSLPSVNSTPIVGGFETRPYKDSPPGNVGLQLG